MLLPSFGSFRQYSLDIVVPHHSTLACGHCSKRMLHSNLHVFMLTPLIDVNFGVQELKYCKLHDAFDIIFIKPSLCG